MSTTADREEMNVSKQRDGGRLVQIQRRRLSVTKLPRGEDPVYQTKLEENQKIIGVVFEWEADSAGRKTVDHYLTVMVATTL